MAKESVSSVSSLLSRPFATRSFEEKKNIIVLGRDKPKLELKIKTKVGNKECHRYFDSKYYEQYEWMTGCPILNKLFCFPCLLFCQDQNTWTTTGYCDLNNLITALSRHKKSQNHLNSVIALKTFDRQRIDTAIDHWKAASIQLHNRSVEKNRNILKRLIHCIEILACQELPFQGHDEIEESNNKGNFLAICEAVAEYDDCLRLHLDYVKKNADCVFSGLSSDIQNEIINCIAATIEGEIKAMIDKTSFVAVMFEETMDFQMKSQLSRVLRFVDEKERPQERFLGYIEVSKDRRAASLTEEVRKFVNQFNCGQKLIAQTYDGASVMAWHLNSVQARVKEVFGANVLFVHCYAHSLNLVLSQSASSIRECRIFFQTLKGISTFFSKSTARIALLDEIIGRRFPKLPETQNYSSQQMSILSNKITLFSELFSTILENPEGWSASELAQVRGFVAILEDFQFKFLLVVFESILSDSEILFSILQKSSLDILRCIREVENFKKQLVDIKNNKFEEFYCRVLDGIAEPPEKRGRRQEPEAVLRTLFDNILDEVIVHIEQRFKTLEEFKFVELLNPKLFHVYEKKFPMEAFSSLDACKNILDLDGLRCELKSVYAADFSKQASSIQEVANIIRELELNQALAEVTKLVRLILTVPATSASCERSFSSLKRVNNYMRCSQSEKRSSNLVFISMNKDLLKKMKIERGADIFYSKVIDEFAKKKQRIELVYK